MKTNLTLYLIAALLFAAGCSFNKQSGGSLACIDVTLDFPEKEILLNNIADVTYLHIKPDNDEYLFKGTPVAISANTIVIHDESSGSILFFAKDGNAKSRFNHKGNGPEDYINVNQVVYDEEKDEAFIVHMSRIQVYSSAGKYKRTLSLPKETVVSPIVSFDENSLFLYDANFQRGISGNGKTQPEAGLQPDKFASPFVRISKIDGKVLDYVEIPTAPVELGLSREMDGSRIMVRARTNRLIKSGGGVFLCNPESDTVFFYGKNKPLTPVAYKTPSITTQNPMVYLNNCIDAGKYQFMEVYTIRFEPGALPYPVAYIMRDKETGEVSKQKIVLPDYKGKIFHIGPRETGRDYENGAFFELDLMELKQAYKGDLLSGKLKELVAPLNEEEDNNIFVFFRFKG